MSEKKVMQTVARIVVVLILIAAAWAVVQYRRTAAFNNRAVRLLDEGRYAEALPLLEKARSRTPGNTALLRNLARTYDNLDRDQEALGAYRALLAKVPGDADAKRRLQEIEDENGVRERAAGRVGKMKAEGWKEDQDALELTLKLGDTYFQIGDFEKALLFYKRALFKDPANLLAERRIEAIENRAETK